MTLSIPMQLYFLNFSDLHVIPDEVQYTHFFKIHSLMGCETQISRSFQGSWNKLSYEIFFAVFLCV